MGGLADGRDVMKGGVVPRGRFRSGHALLVMVGTFCGPAAQWLVFFFIARNSGSSAAGEFALLLAISTPVVTATNWGLRNGYITLSEERRFVDFVALRLLGVLIAGVSLSIFGILFALNLGMVFSVVLMKTADSLTDIWYARWQRSQNLAPFGWAMILNGVLTVFFGALASVSGLAAPWIVLGSAMGSVGTFAGVLFVDREAILRGLRYGFMLSGARIRLQAIAASCWTIGLGQVLAGIVANLPTWAVGFFGTSADVGRFAAAAYVITVGSLLGASLNSVMLGRYRAEMISGGIRSVERAARRGTLLVTGVGLFVVVVLGVVGVQLFQLIYGGQFLLTRFEIIIVAAAAALNPGTFMMNAALLAANRYRAQLSVVAVALCGSLIVAATAGGFQAPGFLVGALCALGGSALKFVVSFGRLGQLATD